MCMGQRGYEVCTFFGPGGTEACTCVLVREELTCVHA